MARESALNTLTTMQGSSDFLHGGGGVEWSGVEERERGHGAAARVACRVASPERHRRCECSGSLSGWNITLYFMAYKFVLALALAAVVALAQGHSWTNCGA